MRSECRADVEAFIAALDVADGWKRAAYLQWLLQTETPYQPSDLDKVIASRRPTYAHTPELR